MRGAGLHQCLQLRRVRAERTIPARKPRLQSLNRTIQHDHSPGRLGDLHAFGIKKSPAPKCDDPPILGRGRLVPANREETPLLNLPEPLLALFLENLRDAPPFRLHNLRVKVDELPPRRRGNSFRPRRLSARRRAVEEEIV